MRPAVQIDLLNLLGDLYVWGLAEEWWALVSWSLDGWVEGHKGVVGCSAWVPSANVWPAGDPNPAVRRRTYQDVQRLILPADRVAWPSVIGWGRVTWHHYGVVTADPGPPPEILGTRWRPRQV